jgi:hypothetical protein
MRLTSRIRHRRTVQPTATCAVLDATSAPLPGDAHSGADAHVLAEPQPSPEEAVAHPHLDGVPDGCRVAVVGGTGLLRSLTAALPGTWTVSHLAEVGDLTVADLVVLTAPTPGKIASVLVRQPDAAVVALAHPAARVDAVVELLASGATACVRTSEAGLVAAHLIACARRYSVGAS